MGLPRSRGYIAYKMESSASICEHMLLAFIVSYFLDISDHSLSRLKRQEAVVGYWISL